jgi:hypothetical protein
MDKLARELASKTSPWREKIHCIFCARHTLSRITFHTLTS